MSIFIFCRLTVKKRLYFQAVPSTYAVLGYSPHTALLGLGFPPRLPHGELHFIWHFIITLFITFFLTFPQRGVRLPIEIDPEAEEVFQSTHPLRGATAKIHKFLCVLLWQKALLRQFHTKRRLLKRFSTYKHRKNFSICGANCMEKICTLPLRTTKSLGLPENRSACSQSARFYLHTFFPSNKIAGYPSLHP